MSENREDIGSIKLRNRVLESELQDLRGKYDEVALSNSYRIGRIITSPLRFIKRTARGFRKKYGVFRNVADIRKIILQKYDLKIVTPTSKPSISVVVRSIEHPTSSTFIRLVSPLRHIAEQYNQKIELVDGDAPAIASSVETIIVQRTALIDMKAAEYTVRRASEIGAKLFVDTDDAFGELDVNHPQYALQKERVDALNFVIENADEVWFSTPKLQSVYDTKRSKVVRNTLDEMIWTNLRDGTVRIPSGDSPLEMLYMGTKTHDGDFKLILPALQKLYEIYPGQFRLHMVGVSSQDKEHPWLRDLAPSSGLYPLFVEWYNTIGPFDIGLSPLEDTAFNRNKSDIKCLDYMGIGVKPVVSDLEAYVVSELDEHIVRVKNDSDSWFEALEKELQNRSKNRASAKERAGRGYDYIKQHRLSTFPAEDIARSIIDEEQDQNA